MASIILKNKLYCSTYGRGGGRNLLRVLLTRNSCAPVNMTIHDIVYGGDTTTYDVNTVPLRPYMVNYGPYTVPYFSRKHAVYDTARVRP